MAETVARLYLGNLPYVAQKSDIEDFFAKNNFAIKKVDISTDPFTGRNPSYCFVDFHSENEAAQAMQDLQGHEIRGRAVRINPKTERSAARDRPPTKAWDRDWSRRELPPKTATEHAHAFGRGNRNHGQPHSSAPEIEKRRIWVGGLPLIPNQDSLDAEMHELFSGYNVEAVSSLMSPQSPQHSTPGSNSFCFIDVSSASEAQEAVQALNGKENPHGGSYLVRLSQRRNPGHATMAEREQRPATSRVFVGNLPHYDQQPALENEIRQLFSGFDVRSVTKLFKPTAVNTEGKGEHYFCFVELASPEDAQNAVEALDNKPAQSGAAYKIRMARPSPSNANNANGGNSRYEQKKPPGPPRDFAGSWRRKD